MTPQNQRIGWLIAIVAIVALATPRLHSQSAGTNSLNVFRKLSALRQTERLRSITIKEQFM